MKHIFCTAVCITLYICCPAQLKNNLSSKVSVEINPNLETYFFAERLAVQKIDNFVFDHKDWDYSHQPIVYFGFKHFEQYKDLPCIGRIADLLKQIRDTYFDNAPIFAYLITQKTFPAAGNVYSQSTEDAADTSKLALLTELTDSLRQFYRQAHVGIFLKKNIAFYKGALKEEEKDIDVPAFAAMEKWYGKAFAHYNIYLAPSMPITAGEDNYRGAGVLLHSKNGDISAMIISTEKMDLPLQPALSAYHQFGFNNPAVTHLLTKHEMGHSFINPLVDKYQAQLVADSLLFTPALKEILAPHYINDWHVCVIEHLVRLGEIRSALLVNDMKEVQRLRKVHIGEYKCVLLHLLEEKIKEYENNRVKYPDFKSYLPVLMLYLHSLTLEIINEQVQKFKNYPVK